jgi:hypothetical protein
LLTRTGGRGELPKAACMKEVQAELGRRLREEYITAHPLPDRVLRPTAQFVGPAAKSAEW